MRPLRRFAAIAATLGIALAGCVTSEQPLLGDGEALFGDSARFQLFSLHDGAAHDPSTVVLRWSGGRYVGTGGDFKDAVITFHRLEGGNLLVQSVDARRGRPVEYALARPLAEAVYLVVPVDESDADAAIRATACADTARYSCSVADRDKLLALARATAAKRHGRGGLAIRIAADDN